MNKAFALRRLLYSFATLALLIVCFGSTTSAQDDGKNSGGVGRFNNGQIVRVTVKLAARLERGVRVNVMDGSNKLIAHGLTGKTGTYTVPLDAGNYTVSVKSAKGTATTPLSVIKSTDPALVTLTLAPAAK